MTFYEQELRKLFADGTVIGSPKFTGRACLGTLGKDLRARVQFVTSGHADHYDVISVTVLNRTDGVVDKLRLRLKDVLGVKQVPGNPNFRNGVAPHIWEDSGKVEWYAFRPSAADYSAMRQAVSEYLGVFRDRVTERRQDGPRLVYICAPLRGEAAGTLPNGILYLKGGDLRDELQAAGKPYRTYEIADFFDGEFFETKKVVYFGR